jgi:hypothetical protein
MPRIKIAGFDYEKQRRQRRAISRSMRATFRTDSNNPDNPNKNICCLAVAYAFGVADRVRYLHTMNDVKRALRCGYSVRSVKNRVTTAVRKGKSDGTLDGVRAIVKRRFETDDTALAILVETSDPITNEGHVLVLGKDGSTLVDTAPDGNAKVEGIWGIYKKPGHAYQKINSQ